MNKWEHLHKYRLDSISAMVNYAEHASDNKDSDEYKTALYYWATELSDDYKKQWELENGKLDETDWRFV